jgi:hypothetical protein
LGLLVAIFFVFAVSCTNPSANDPFIYNPPPIENPPFGGGGKTLSGITIKSLPTKTTYAIGDDLNLTGLVITATYNDGSQADITDLTKFFTLGGSSIPGNQTGGFDSSIPGDQTVTIGYYEEGSLKQTSFTVTIDPNLEAKVLDSIAITTLPSKITYIMGENLDRTGMVVTAYYTDSSSEIVDSYGCSYNGMTMPGIVIINVSYTERGIEKTTTFEITVTVGGFSYTALNEGIWANGSLTEPIYVYSTYCEQWFSFPVNSGTPYYIWKISDYSSGYSRNPDIYYSGDSWTSIDVSFESWGVPYSTSRSGDSWVDLTETSFSDGFAFTADHDGTAYIRVGGDEAADFQIAYSTSNSRPNGGMKTLSKISVTPPSQIDYIVNESLNLAGMAVIAYYTDNTQVDVTNSGGVTTEISSNGNMNTPGSKTIFVNYSEDPYYASDRFYIEVYATPTYSVRLYNNDESYNSGHTFPEAVEGYGAQTPWELIVSNTGNRPSGNLTLALSGTGSGSFTLSTASIGSIAVRNTGSFTVWPNAGLAVGYHSATVTASGGNGIDASFSVGFWVVLKAPTGIAVTTLPSKTTYFVGDTFTPAGMVVTADYNDGSQAVVTGYNLSSPDMSTGGTKTVTVSYYAEGSGTKTTTFQIMVAPHSYDISLKNNGSVLSSYDFQEAVEGYGAQTSLTVSVSNTGSQPTGGLALALSGTGSGSFTLSTASIGSITVGNTGGFTVSPNTGLAVGYYSATVTASGGNGISASFSVSFRVVSKALTGITVTTLPAKTTYVAGETFTPAGMAVTANYNDGSQTTVTGYGLSSPDMSTAGTKTVTVSYTDGGVTKTATFQITVVAKALTGIAVTTQPTKTSYIVGEALDTTGMAVTASYNDSSTAAVSTYTTSGFNNGAAAANQTVTVSYTEGGITKTATFTVTITLPASGNMVALYWVNEGELVFSNGASVTVPRTGNLIISAQGTDYTGQRWFINGIEDAAQTGQSSYTFSGVNREAGKKNVIGLRTVKNGALYYAELTVTVTAE